MAIKIATDTRIGASVDAVLEKSSRFGSYFTSQTATMEELTLFLPQDFNQPIASANLFLSLLAILC